MAKGKMKKYKPPDSKYLVVVDPWGTPGHRCFIGNVAAWFELMLKDDYPYEDVKTIFTQRTHNNIIVELSESVDILPYLGAHPHSRFLTQPHNFTDNISYIYEYDYETQNDPTRRGWTANYPSEYDIKIFPIVQPYPPPLPAPPPPFHVAYAKRPPNVLVTPPSNAVLNYMSLSNVPIPNDTQLPTPGPNAQQGSNPNPVANFKKRDPYEEADEAERLLRIATSPSSASIKQEDGRQGVLLIKKEEPNHTPMPKREQQEVTISAVDDFLDSIIPVKKEEPIPHQIHLSKREPEDGVMPNPALSIPIIKREEPIHAPLSHRSGPSVKMEQDGSEGDDYQPSADLLAAFADFQPNMLNQAPSITHTDIELPDGAFSAITQRGRSTTLATEIRDDVGLSTVHVKPEPRDDYEIPPSELRPVARTQDPRIVQRHRLTTLATEPREAEHSTVRVTPEPQEDHFIPPPQHIQRTRDPRLANHGHPMVRVKPEPREDHSIPPPVPRTRDPRLANREQRMVAVKPEPRDDRAVPPSHPIQRTRDPRFLHRVNGHAKHPLDDEHEKGIAKRIKSEE